MNPSAHNRIGPRLQERRLVIGRFLWATIATSTVVFFVLTIPVRYRQLVAVAADNQPYLEQLGLTTQFLVAYLVFLDTTALLSFCLIAAAIVFRKSDDWFTLFVSAMFVMMGVLLTRPVESLATVSPAGHIPFVLTLAFGVSAIILFMFLFPDGRFVPSWSRWLAFGWVAWVFAWYLVPVVLIRPMPWPPRLQPGLAVAGWIGCGLAVQIYRYRAVSNAAQRQQTKWVVLGLAASALGFMAYLYLIPAFIPASAQPGMTHLLYILFGVPTLYLSLILMPLTIGISISRYRLWDISVLVNRTLVYGVLTVLITIVYLGFVLVSQPLFRALIGHTSILAIAVSTLATAVLIYPLRQRVQAGIDHRLFPRKYDSARVLASLSTTLRDEVDLTRLTEQLESAVSEVLQPASVFSWLRTPSSFRVYILDETLTLEEASTWVDGEVPLDDPLVTYLASRTIGDVASLDRLNLASPALQRLKAAGVTILMLLHSRGELIGWLSLGPRLDEQGYSADDLSFLELVAAQAGPAVRVAQLAQEQQVVALERLRMNQQLQVARLVQQTLLPHQWPESPGWHVAGHYQPAQAVGGDFYDVLSFKDGRWGLIIGDVSDKGIPAALLMASTRSMLRSIAYQSVTPGAVLERANRLLLPDLLEGLFVTCLYAILDPVSGHLSLANAGHNPPCLRTDDGVTELWMTGMPLGWLPDVSYEEYEMKLEPGASLLFYSDGLTEARNREGELFGTSRLHTLLAQTTSVGSELIDELMQEVEEFCGPKELDDDVTILTLCSEAVRS